MTKSNLGAASAALVALAGISSAPGAVLAAPRAEASTDPKALIESLNQAVAELRSKHEEQLNSKVDDAVLTEHIDRITASIDKIEAAQDEQARKLTAASLGGNGGRNIVDQEYSNAFASYFKKNKVEASLNKGADDEGGYLAPEEWDRTITDKLVEVSPMRAICRVQPSSKSAFSKLFNKRGTSSGWVGETAARPETNTPELGSLAYTIGEMYANPAATQGMLDDAVIDVESWLAEEIQTEFALQEGTAFLSGNGTNKPTGILTYVTGAANAAVHPLGDIKLVNSESASTIGDGDSIIALTDALPNVFAANARFGMSRGTRGKVRLLKDGQ
ncbi:MAG: phage major capsid protein, partial [Parasphingorhabdus sp.]